MFKEIKPLGAEITEMINAANESIMKQFVIPKELIPRTISLKPARRYIRRFGGSLIAIPYESRMEYSHRFISIRSFSAGRTCK